MSVVGGMSRVVKGLLSMAMEAGAITRFERTVTSIKRLEDDSVKVCHRATTGDQQKSAVECAEYDAVIVTVPLPALQQILFSPPLGRAKQRAIRTTEYDEATKVAIRFAGEKPPWDATRFPPGSRVETDLDSRQLYFLNDNIVMSYTWGVDAERLATMTHDMRVERVVQDVARLIDQDADELTKKVAQSTSKSWKSDPAFGGAFTLYHAGNYVDNHCGTIGDDYDPSPTAPYGLHSPVRFTGEHKDPAGHAWIETSLISVIEELDILASKTKEAWAKVDTEPNDTVCQERQRQ